MGRPPLLSVLHGATVTQQGFQAGSDHGMNHRMLWGGAMDCGQCTRKKGWVLTTNDCNMLRLLRKGALARTEQRPKSVPEMRPPVADSDAPTPPKISPIPTT